MLWKKLRLGAAKLIGIDPDRLTIITRSSQEHHYDLRVEGAITRDQELKLRRFVNENSAAHVRWTVHSTQQ